MVWGRLRQGWRTAASSQAAGEACLCPGHSHLAAYSMCPSSVQASAAAQTRTATSQLIFLSMPVIPASVYRQSEESLNNTD